MVSDTMKGNSKKGLSKRVCFKKWIFFRFNLNMILTGMFVTGFLFIACANEGRSMGSLMRNTGLFLPTKSQIPSSE
jgi:hypothetical protein